MRVAPDKRSSVRGNDSPLSTVRRGSLRAVRGGPWKEGVVGGGRLPRAAVAALLCLGYFLLAPCGAAEVRAGKIPCRSTSRAGAP